MDTIKVTYKTKQVDITYSTFPAGEKYVRITDPSIFKEGFGFVIVDILSGDSDTIMNALLIADALKQLKIMGLQVVANFGYFPYGRQDRVCKEGESFSLKVFTEMLNLRFDLVTTIDTHSKVTNTLLGTKGYINEVTKSSSYIDTMTMRSYYLDEMLTGKLFISPDKGAIDRTNTMNNLVNGEDNKHIIVADKVRTNEGGIEIKMTPSNMNMVIDNKEFVISDDISDGGGTFIVLAKNIKHLNPTAKLTLVLSHGIFSKGLEVLYEHYDRVYVLDTEYNLRILNGLKIK